jgi:hypothetical protein
MTSIEQLIAEIEPVAWRAKKNDDVWCLSKRPLSKDHFDIHDELYAREQVLAVLAAARDRQCPLGLEGQEPCVCSAGTAEREALVKAEAKLTDLRKARADLHVALDIMTDRAEAAETERDSTLLRLKVYEQTDADVNAEFVKISDARAATAEARLKEAEELLRLCQSTLAMMVAPDAIKQASVVHAYAQAVEAESKCRAFLSKGDTNENQ